MNTKIQRREVPRKRYSAAHLALSNARAPRVPRNRYNTAGLALSDTVAPRLTCNTMAAPLHRKDLSLTTYPSGSLSSDADVSDDNGEETYEDARPPPDALHQTTYDDARPPPDDQHQRSISPVQHQRSAAHMEAEMQSIKDELHSAKLQLSEFVSKSSIDIPRPLRPKFHLRTFGKDVDNYTIEEFISIMNDYVKPFDKDSNELRACIKTHITGEAAIVVLNADAQTWEDMKTALLLHYRPECEYRAHMATLEIIRQQNGESPASLAVRVRRCAKKAFPHLQLADLDSIMIKHFLRAMDNKELTRLALTQDLRLFEKVIEISTRLSMADAESGTRLSLADGNTPVTINLQDARHEVNTNEATMDYIDKIVIARVDHAISEMPRGRSRNRQSRERPYVQCSPEIRDNGRDRSRDNNTQWQYSDNGEGRRDQYRDRSPHAQENLQRARSDSRRSRDRRPQDGQTPDNAQRPRSTSRNRSCFKCHGSDISSGIAQVNIGT